MLMVDLLGMLLVKGPSQYPLRAQWPLHQALAELNAVGTTRDLAGALPTFSFKPDGLVGTVDESAVMALHELVANGTMRAAGEGWNAALELSDDERLRPY